MGHDVRVAIEPGSRPVCRSDVRWSVHGKTEPENTAAGCWFERADAEEGAVSF